MQTDKLIAYFSMEIALDPAMPTYSGGLGVLAGDTLRGAADRALKTTTPKSHSRIPSEIFS